MLAGAAGANETVLRAFITLDFGILERRPVRLLVFEAADIFFHDLFERNALELFRARMPCSTHERILLLAA